MKPYYLLLLILTLFCCHLSQAQQPAETIRLKAGDLRMPSAFTQTSVDDFYRSAKKLNNKTQALLQFASVPNEQQRKQLAQAGVELHNYLSANTYLVTLRSNPGFTTLQGLQVKNIISLPATFKMQESLRTGQIPPHAIKKPGYVDVWFRFLPSFSTVEVEAALKEKDFEILPSSLLNYRIAAARIPVTALLQLAAEPFVEYLQPSPPADKELNMNSRTGTRAGLLNASIANGGRGLNGSGVVVGVGDNADLNFHIDFRNRFINRTWAANNSIHGLHVAGTLGGAGLVSEIATGFAPKATMINQLFSGIWINASSYVQDYGMVVTNNSYGASIDCDYHGIYDIYSSVLDQQAFEFPHLQHVFASGNNGNTNCSSYPAGFGTVLGAYQSSKNVITVGNTSDSGVVFSGSSKGPVRDGRLKPEIVTMGWGVYSNGLSNSYWYNTGTSMAAPAASGGLTLLYQRYRQLNSNANPKSGLMKALLLNGATDRGNAGPDYSYGFGWMNLLRSMEMMENSRYVNDSTTNAATKTHSISVPANTAQLKVMLYWHDPAASLLSTQALVHDLDLQVVNPSAATLLPSLLDTVPGNVNNPAGTGVDRINNVEQVVINNPAAGNYDIKVIGTAITETPRQEYFVVYDIIPVSLQISQPTGGEALVPGETTKITWESYGDNSSTYTLEYSTNNGSTWNLIDNGVTAASRLRNWVVPAVATEQAKVRVTNNGNASSSVSNAFTILGVPSLSLAAVQCEGYINLDWTAVTGATDYEVMLLQNGEFVPVATTTSTNYIYSGLNKDSIQWVTVRARLNGVAGRRAIAISRLPNTGTCSGTISDNDLKIDAIVAPVSGRELTSTALSAATQVQVRVKNLDDNAISNYTLKYFVNGVEIESVVVAGPLNGGSTYTHSFSTTYNFSSIASYTLTAVVDYASDPVSANDTATVIIKHLPNQPVDLTTDLVENLDASPVQEHIAAQTGLQGLDRFDFTNTSTYGRLRTNINTGIAYSGQKAITLDTDRDTRNSVNTNYVDITYNLSNYDAVAGDDLRFDFQFNHHGQLDYPNNRVWVRSNDASSWIEAYNLYNNQEDPGTYKKTTSIELSNILRTAGQNFSTSFQVRIGQQGFFPAADRYFGGGYTIDDIRLYKVLNDMQLISIDTPIVSSCGLNGTTPIGITVRNSSLSAVTNVPVRYSIDGGGWQSETIPSIGANSSVTFVFAQTANLFALGAHNIRAVVDYAGDSFRENDTAVLDIMNTPVINSFPYLQDFESSDGHWFSTGKNNSWEYGTPASSRINTAASGTKAWKTNLDGGSSDNELSYLYSPCFDLTGMTAPTLSFSLSLDIEDCGSTLCDGAWMEYSKDGKTWAKLGANGQGTNWYNKGGSQQLWSIEDYHRWHVATIPIPEAVAGMRFRFVMQTDPAVGRNGIAIDDIHVYDNTKGIYDGITLAAPVTQSVSGNGWIDFTSGGKLIASIHPNNQNLGSTDVQAYINTTPVRYTATQYYHDRNITIKPATLSPADSVTVRFYFMDTETEALIAATGCSSCSKPGSAYELGVSKYADIDDSYENGTIADNNQGLWSFIVPGNVTKVPFDKGYYAEFKVKDFSEFWLNNGGFNRLSPLPVKLMDFNVQKQNNNDVLVRWTVAAESNVSHYEIEVARSNADLQAGNFIKLGDVNSLGATDQERDYSFTDTEAGKFGTRYYRLKIVDQDASFVYSPIRSVVFEDAVTWQIYPNPSAGKFNLVYQLSSGEVVEASVYDAQGRLIQQSRTIASGMLQKQVIDITGAAVSPGVYILRIHHSGTTRSYKLYKQ